MDDRTPVLVGAAQFVQRDVSPADALEPAAMLELVAREAARDTGAGERALHALDTLLLIPVARWAPANPLDLLCTRLDIAPATQYMVGSGGETGVANANRAAQWITRGEAQAVLITGCNPWKTTDRAAAAGLELGWDVGGQGKPTPLGAAKPGGSDLELRHGLDKPIAGYPMFENARRAARGRSIAEHHQRLGALMHRFTAVAAANPYAWFPTERSADELVTVSPTNRMVGFPYTKYLNAVIATDQAAAIIMMSAGTARALRIPEDRWVYWWGGHAADEEAWFVSERPRFDQCPAMQEAHTTALAHAGIGTDQVDLFDFYSCFPVAVEMAIDALGLDEDDERGFTITGGLPYAGGPASAYTLHSLATTSQRLRDHRDAIALITGNGFFLTKHAASVWSGRPPGTVTGTPPVAGTTLERKPAVIDEAPTGSGRVEAYTVLHDASSTPVLGIVAGRTDDGLRFLANLPTDADVLASFTTAEGVGRTGRLRPQGQINRFHPD